jgi:hypothetical protein
MSSILSRISVKCPLNQAGRHLENFFEGHLAPGGDHAVVLLQAGERLKHAVDVTLAKAHAAGDMTPRFNVRWTPHGGGPYPEFTGELHVDADEDYNACFIRLEGTYDPPGGAAGQVFDAVVGRTIAQSTGDHFVAAIRDFIEHDFALEEARKAAG